MGVRGGKAGPNPRLIAAAGALAAGLFIAVFRLRRLGPFDFWDGLALAVFFVSILSFAIDRDFGTRLKEDLRLLPLRKAAIGVASALALYAIFAAGRALSLRIFPFVAPAGIGQIYALRSDVPIVRMIVLISLIIGPGEELFWRGFFQERAGATTGRVNGFILTALLYSSVHLASGNIMLVLAAAVCGLFWGGLYLRFRSPLLNIISHTLWDLLVFVLFPF